MTDKYTASVPVVEYTAATDVGSTTEPSETPTIVIQRFPLGDVDNTPVHFKGRRYWVAAVIAAGIGGWLLYRRTPSVLLGSGGTVKKIITNLNNLI